MVGVSSVAASLGSCRLASPPAPEAPRLYPVVGSLRCAGIQGHEADNARILTPSSRRVIPLVGALVKEASSSFDETLQNSDKPVLVDFYATWCGPCQYMSQVLDHVGAILGDRIEIVKVDTQKEKAIATKYHIEALPTFIVFKDGEPCDRFVGAMPMTKFFRRLKTALDTPK